LAQSPETTPRPQSRHATDDRPRSAEDGEAQQAERDDEHADAEFPHPIVRRHASSFRAY
jgi:hypothetical protein